MEFGKVPSSSLEHIDFTLPSDGWFTQQILPGTPAGGLKVCTGAPKWAISGWVGSIYPEGAKEKDFLQHYVRQFNSIELNATHYKIYDETAIARWAEKAQGTDFRFCPKIPQSISHYSDLGSVRAQEITTQFLEGILAFGEHLGPIFLQLSEKYSPDRKEALLYYLDSLPTDLEFYLEVRHPSWFEDAAIREWLFGNLHHLGIGAVITDTAGRRDCLHMELTVPKTFIRFVGNGMHPTDFTRVDSWIDRLETWISRGLEEVWFFMHQPHELHSPQMCDYFIRKMNERLGLNLEPPRFLEPQSQGTLFD